MEKYSLNEFGYERFININSENMKAYILKVFNGFNKKDNELYVNSYEKLLDCFKEQELEIKNIYIDTYTIMNGYTFGGELMYRHRGFPIQINMTDNVTVLLDSIKEKTKMVDNLLSKNGGNRYVFYLTPQRLTINAFNLYSSYLTIKELKEVGRSLYKSSDFGANYINKDILKKVFSHTLSNLDDLFNGKDYIEIYRGVGSESTNLERAYAWTTDINVAKFFATRFLSIEEDKDSIKVYKLNITKDYIVGYIEDEEREVLIDTDYLKYNEPIEIEFDKSISYEMPKRTVKVNNEINIKENENEEESKEPIVISQKLLDLFK